MAGRQPHSGHNRRSEEVGGRHRRPRDNMDGGLDMNPSDREVVSTLISMRRTIEAMPPESEDQQVDPFINVDGIDDEITMWPSSKEFSRARNRSKAAVSDIIVLDEDVPETALTLSIHGQRNSFKRNPINWEAYKNMESSHTSKKQCVEKIQGPQKPAYFCRVCWGPIIDGTSTRCGHIFCEKCIKEYIKENKRCPICVQKLTMKNFHRVYLPDPDPDPDSDVD